MFDLLVRLLASQFDQYLSNKKATLKEETQMPFIEYMINEGTQVTHLSDLFFMVALV